MESAVHIQARALRSWTACIFEHCGVNIRDAALAASALLRTSLRGIDTHGLARLPAYVERLQSGAFNPHGIARITERHGILHCHGDGALGQVVLHAALQSCLSRAPDVAITACCIEASGH